MTFKLVVVVPVFNEEQGIANFHARLSQVLVTIPEVLPRIHYIVDPCTDRTVDVLKKVMSDSISTTVITLSTRFGHQAALLAGIDSAVDADAILMMDGDLQHPPELIPSMLAKFREGYDVVFTIRAETQNISLPRQILGDMFYWALGKLSSVTIRPNAADFRIISGRIGRLIATDFQERRLFLRGLFSWIGFKQASITFKADERLAGSSKYTTSKMIQLGVAGIVSFSAKPLYLGLVIGAVFSAVALMTIFWTLGAFFVQRSIPSGWTTITVLLSLFSGIQLIVLGIIGVYIGGIYDEVKGRPRYLIDEVISSDERRKGDLPY